MDTGKAFLNYDSETLLAYVRSHDWVERALFIVDTLLIDTTDGECLDFNSLKDFRDYAGY